MRLFFCPDLRWLPIRTPNEEIGTNWIEIEGFESLSWTERSNDFGEFKLRIMSEKIEPRFGTYGVFMRDDSDFVMICEDIHATQVESGGFMQEYSGRSLESMLEWRITENKQQVLVNKSEYFDPQRALEAMLHENFGAGAYPSRKIPGFNVRRDTSINSYIKPNIADFDGDWSDEAGLVIKRDYVSKYARMFLNMVKPNGFPMFYRIRMRNGGFWVDMESPYLVEPLVLSPGDDDIKDFEYLWSNRKKYSSVYEVYEHYLIDPNHLVNGKSWANVLTIRKEVPLLRREAVWDNSSDHKVIDPNSKDGKVKDPKTGLTVNDYSDPYYFVALAAEKAQEYTPVMEYSAKLDGFGGNLRYNQDFFVGDVFRYIPDPGHDLRQTMREPNAPINWETYASQRQIDLQITEVTESWHSSGYTMTPAFTGYAEKWKGEGKRVAIEYSPENTYRANRSR